MVNALTALFGVMVGLIVYSQMLLPLIYGLPRSIYHVLRGDLRSGAIAWQFGAPLIWAVGLICLGAVLALISPSVLNFLTANSAFLLGNYIAVALLCLNFLTAEGRETMSKDWTRTTFTRFQTNSSPTLAFPTFFDLDDLAHVLLIDEIRSACGTEMESPGAYAECLYRPASQLPYPKPVIRMAIQALLDFASGQRESSILDESIRNAKSVDTFESVLHFLDNYLEIPPSELPTETEKNLRVGSAFLGSIGDKSGAVHACFEEADGDRAMIARLIETPLDVAEGEEASNPVAEFLVLDGEGDEVDVSEIEVTFMANEEAHTLSVDRMVQLAQFALSTQASPKGSQSHGQHSTSVSPSSSPIFLAEDADGDEVEVGGVEVTFMVNHEIHSISFTQVVALAQMALSHRV